MKIPYLGSEFVPAKIRRIYRRGKRADKAALVAYLYRTMLDELWRGVFIRNHPFLDRYGANKGFTYGAKWLKKS